MRTCIEGCGNILTHADDSRFPESLSRPLPDTQQGVEKNDIQRLDMRLRCSSCYSRRYDKQYYAISYRWSHENRNHSLATVTVHDESTRTITPGVPIPVRNQRQRALIMSCKLFFLDVLNASSRSGQWYTSNLWRTYTSCKGVKILLGASDHELLQGKREEHLHLSGLTRDRDGYLRTKYGKQERASAYTSLPPDAIRFYSMYGRDMGNIEVEGLVQEEDNIYQLMVEDKSHLLYGSGNTRPAGYAIAQMFPTPRHKSKKTGRSRRRIPVNEQNQEVIVGANGHLAVQTPAYVTPGSMPADLDTGFAEPSPWGTIPSVLGTGLGPFLDPPSLDSSLNLTGIGGSTLGFDLEAPPIPSSYNPSLNITSLDGSAGLLAAGMDPSATSNMLSDVTGVGDASIASMTDNMSAMHISSESRNSSDPHYSYMFPR